MRVQQTVDRSLVHKVGVADVFLMEGAHFSGGEFTLAAQWPRRHWYFGEPARRLDPLLVVETLRQTCLYLAFAHLDVPVDSFVIIDSLRASCLAARAQPDAPVDLVIRGRAVLNGGLAATKQIRLETEYRNDGMLLARASGSATVLEPKVYKRFRELRRTEPAESGATMGDALQFDRRHPVYFDHPSDHVPGLALLDQALRLAAPAENISWRPVSLGAKFMRFVELDRAAAINITRERELASGLQQKRIQVRQGSLLAAEVSVRVFQVAAVRRQ